MKAVRMIVLGGALALVSTAAWAFQEQQGGAAPAAPVKTAPAAADKAPAANLGTIEAPAGKIGGEGTEVRIPGLGRLGVLPKMDFGLELLYGATEAKRPEDRAGFAEPGRDAGSDDLILRGTLRRKF
jgi:hypothetical protein